VVSSIRPNDVMLAIIYVSELVISDYCK